MKNIINKKFWKNKKVLITGHTGFKGAWLCVFLKFLGAKVIGYSLKPITNPSLFYQAKISNKIEKSYFLDIRDKKKLFEIVKINKPQIVFHLAAQPIVRKSFAHPDYTFDVNFNGTLNILECIKKFKFIKSSIIITTDKVYDIKKNKIFKESDLLGGKDPYSVSKVCCELLYKSYNDCFFNIKEFSKNVATVRAGNVIGGGDYSEDRIIPDIYRSLKKKKTLLLRNPNSVRPWQHVLEPLSGYIILAEKLFNNKLKKIIQNWNFGPNISSCKSVKYVATKFSKPLGIKILIKKIDKSRKKKFETDFLRLSNNKAKKILNWYPKWHLDKAIEKIIEWNSLYKNNSYKGCISQIKEFIGN
jgi:CDP-glucose 4,6-dehydratase